MNNINLLRFSHRKNYIRVVSSKSDNQFYFPRPMTRFESTGKVIGCIVYKLYKPPTKRTRRAKPSIIYVAHSADCLGVHGAGDTQEEAIRLFKVLLESNIEHERNGGIFPGKVLPRIIASSTTTWNGSGLKIILKFAMLLTTNVPCL